MLLAVKRSRLKTKILSTIEKIGDNATTGTTIVILPCKSAVLRDIIAEPNIMPAAANQRGPELVQITAGAFGPTPRAATVITADTVNPTRPAK